MIDNYLEKKKNIYDFLQMLKIPSANDFRFPHRVDAFGISASLICLLDLSLNNGKTQSYWDQTDGWKTDK